MRYFDPFVLDVNPFPAFAQARAEGGALSGAPPFPGVKSVIYLFTHRLVNAALKHPSLLHAPPGAYELVRQSLVEERAFALFTRSVLLADPPRHGVLRRPLSQAIAPSKRAALIESLPSEALKLATRLARDERFDAVRDFAVPFAVEVMGRLLGMPIPTPTVLKTATAAITRAIDLRRAPVNCDAESKMLEAEIERTLAAGDIEPDGLAAAMLEEEAAGRWERADVIANIYLLMFAGQETTIDAFGNALLELAAAPTQRALLDRRAVDWDFATEELLRLGTSVCYAGARIAAEDLHIDEVAVPAGTAVVPVLASANRDTAVWPAGDQLRLDTPRSAGLTFSTGLHMCLGKHLAHAEMAALLAALFTAAPSWRLDRTAVRRRDTRNFRGLTSAPVEVSAHFAITVDP